MSLDSAIPDFIKKHLAKSVRVTFLPKKLILKEEEPTKNIYFILSGLVRIYTLNEEGKEVTLSLRGTGEIVGLHSFILDSIARANAEAIEKTEALAFSKNDFREILSSSPSFLFNLLNYLAYEIRQENKYLKRVFTDNLENRTLKTIKRLSKLSKDGSVHLSHEQLSSIIGATRPRITETLHKLEKKGKLVRSPKKGLHLVKLDPVIKIPVN